jgi:hypothetical protein
MTLFHRRSVFAFVLGATLAAAVLVGRSAFATTESINACFKPSNGTLYLLGESSGRDVCQPGDIPISWNTSGVNGQDGVSVTSESLAPGDDAACPNGGSKFTAANGISYACNGTNGQDGRDGVDGQDGEDGVDGQDGQDFDGTFTSPNGLFKLIIDDTSARLESPTSRVMVDGQTVRLDAASSRVQVTPGTVQIQASGLFSASGAVTTIGGQQIILNNATCGLLRPTDFAPNVGPVGSPILLNANGSPTVRFGC